MSLISFVWRSHVINILFKIILFFIHLNEKQEKLYYKLQKENNLAALGGLGGMEEMASNPSRPTK